MPNHNKKNKQIEIAATISTESPRQLALGYILDAWDEAVENGIEPDLLANAAIYAALSDLITTYGEDHVVKLAEGLTKRIQHGEFTIYRTTQ